MTQEIPHTPSSSAKRNHDTPGNFERIGQFGNQGKVWRDKSYNHSDSELGFSSLQLEDKWQQTERNLYNSQALSETPQRRKRLGEGRLCNAEHYTDFSVDDMLEIDSV